MNPGRNDPCPCGSQQRYKSCCGRLADAWSVAQDSRDSSEGLQPRELARLTPLLQGGRYAELESAAEEVLEAQPRSALLWQLLGVARARQDKDPLHALRMAVQCAPEDATAHLNLGNAYGDRDDRIEPAHLRHLQIHQRDVRQCRRDCAMDSRPIAAPAISFISV